MKKLNDKKQVVAQISAAARLYKKNLVGKHFLYVFDGRAIEVAYQAKGFRHLTGVDTGLDAMSFYKEDAKKQTLAKIGRIYDEILNRFQAASAVLHHNYTNFGTFSRKGALQSGVV